MSKHLLSYVTPQRVALTNINIGEGITVSTVQLPPDQSLPNPFETMVFTEDETMNEYQVRSATLDEALLAHIDAIAYVIGGKK